MLRSGKKLVKTEYYKELSKKFGRTEKAYEYRMQNISYVLSIQGRDWVSGLRPAKNVGANVAADIEGILAELEGREVSSDVAFESKVKAEVEKNKLSKPSGVKKPNAKAALITQYDRDASVKAWVLLNAKGLCESCARPAPFSGVDGSPFLEVHHVRRLADGGSDTIENAVALCPNCHRELHYGQDFRQRIERLYSTVARLVRE